MTKWVPFVYGFALGGWVIIAHWMVPNLIRDAYDGESHPLLNGLIEGQAYNPVELYLERWRSYFHCSLLIGTCIIPAFYVSFSKGTGKFLREQVGECGAESIAVTRILVFAILLLNVCWESVPSIAEIPESVRVKMG